jgi:hypothetical protein
MTRYLSGLCVASLGLCGGGWLVVTSMAFGGKPVGIADKVNLLTGAGLIAVALIALCCWAMAWRRRMHVDGVLMGRFLPVSRREARRNRRELRRDVRQTARLARRDVRECRKEAERYGQLDLFPVVAGGSGCSGASGVSGVSGTSGASGVSGEDTAELLHEIRTLLGPLRTAVEGRAVEAPDIQEAQPRYSNGVAFAGDGEESW